MNPDTGELYDSVADALRDGMSDPVELIGSPRSVKKVSAAVKAQAKRKRKTARRSRKRNR